MESSLRHNPFVGPLAFRESDQALFFGREREARHLLDLTIVDAEVLVYSPAGAGKSSLLNAALVPMLRREGFDVLPSVRFGRTYGAIEPDAVTNVYVLDTLLSWEDRGVARELATVTLVDYLVSRSDSSQETDLSSPRVAIFDQFEELFTLYPDQWSQRRGFIEQISEALETDQRLRVVFSMREEYIASLDQYQVLFPGRLRARYRLEGLRREAAIEAVIRPSQSAGLTFAPGAAEQLVEDLLKVELPSQDGMKVVIGEFVEPVQLQVVCRRLWDRLSAAGVHQITESDLMKTGGVDGDVDQALSRFYEEALTVTVDQTRVPQGILRRWFDRVLITPLGTRGIVLREPGETGGIPNSAVEALQNLHLVKAELRGGAVWYELTHDRLVAPIRDSNQRWLLEHVSMEVRELEGRAEEWVRGGRRYPPLLSEAELSAAERGLDIEGLESMPYGETLLAFLEASRWALERQKLHRQLARARRLAILAVLLAGAIGIIAWLLH